MAAFDIRIQAIQLFMWLCIAFVVWEFRMVEILVVIVGVGFVALFAAVLCTAKPTDLGEDA